MTGFSQEKLLHSFLHLIIWIFFPRCFFQNFSTFFNPLFLVSAPFYKFKFFALSAICKYQIYRVTVSYLGNHLVKLCHALLLLSFFFLNVFFHLSSSWPHLEQTSKNAPFQLTQLLKLIQDCPRRIFPQMEDNWL